MRQKRLLTTIIGLCLISALTVAEPNSQSTPTQKTPITLVKRNKGVSAGRPKAPDRQNITCAYYGEELHLSFYIPEGMATLSVIDETLLSATYEIDTTPLEVIVPVGELVGTIIIEIDTEKGNNFYGEI